MLHATHIVLALLLMAATALATESVTTRTGATYVGEVTVDQEAQRVNIRTVFPSADLVRLSFDEVTPASLYWIQSKRAKLRNAQERIRLAELAEAAELPGIAISEYLFAIELAPDRRRSLERRMLRVRRRSMRPSSQLLRDVLRR